MKVWPWLVGAVLQLGLLVWTALPPWTPGLGVPTWHHNASLALALVTAAVLWRPMTQDRRFLGIGVLVTTVLALASAFLLLYLKQDLKDWGLKDWAKWWHVAWSWYALVFFAGHTWINRYGTVRALRRVIRPVTPLVVFLALNLAILVAIPLTWSELGARWIVDGNYIPLTLWTWLALLVPAYGAWFIARSPAGRASTWHWTQRPGVQAWTDSWLLETTLLANLTGFPILYFGTKDTALKYVAKYWHTWPSIAMAILVFAHTMQFLPGVARYFRRRTP